MDGEIADGRTTSPGAGVVDASVIVRSASGERVYLPPERAPDGDGEDSPYRPAGDSPYEGPGDDSPTDGPTDSPYDGVPNDSPYDGVQGSSASIGLTPTANGFRIVHPEPVTDVRFLR
jgi:hypothetical protein